MSGTAGEREFAEFLDTAGVPQRRAIERMTGGGNNRVYRVSADDFDGVLKAYFHHPDDPRDRLRAEFAFSRIAWEAGIRTLPQPLASDPNHHLGLYEFVPGRRLEPQEVDASAVLQAAKFVVEVNRHKLTEAARTLPAAAEACFSLEAHLDCVTRRLRRLTDLNLNEARGTDADIDRAAGELVRDVLQPLFAELTCETRRRAGRIGIDLRQEVALVDRCLSPSDFGFHNALTTPGGLRFLDFEYAGWDDPAKLACDFCCQPAVPAAHEYFADFVAVLTAALSDPTMHAARIELLLPVYQLKWCCILLNDFLPIDGRRRQFAGEWSEGGDEARRARKAAQLRKADRMLAAFEATWTRQSQSVRMLRHRTPYQAA
jgi:hypothetical protein